jgi:hypothetical protein
MPNEQEHKIMKNIDAHESAGEQLVFALQD